MTTAASRRRFPSFSERRIYKYTPKSTSAVIPSTTSAFQFSGQSTHPAHKNCVTEKVPPRLQTFVSENNFLQQQLTATFWTTTRKSSTVYFSPQFKNKTDINQVSCWLFSLVFFYINSLVSFSNTRNKGF